MMGKRYIFLFIRVLKGALIIAQSYRHLLRFSDIRNSNIFQKSQMLIYFMHYVSEKGLSLKKR